MKFRALCAYHDIIFDPQVEEEKENIDIAICYEDHGDDYIFVKTKTGERYIYGWFCNLPGWPNCNDLNRTDIFDRWFVRKPVVFKKDDRCTVSNKIYFEIQNLVYKKTSWGISNQIKVEFDHKTAQWHYDYFCRWTKEQNELGTQYHLDSKKDELLKYLEANEIATEENLQKLNSIPFSSRVNGLDGIAGKIDAKERGRVFCDRINYVFKDGNFIAKKKVKTKLVRYDDFGCPTYSFCI